MQRKRTSSRNLRSYWLNLIRLQLVIHQQIFRALPILKLLFFALDYLQPLSFLSISHNQERFNFFEVVRPFLRIEEYFPDHERAFLISLTLILLLDGFLINSLVIRYCYIRSKTITHFEFIASQNLLLKLMIHLHSYFSQGLMVYFYQPLQLLNIGSLLFAIQHKNPSLIFLALLTIILLELSAFSKFFVCSTSMGLQVNMEQLQLSNYSILRYTLHRVQLIIYCSVTSQIDDIIQACLIILISTVSIANSISQLNCPIIAWIKLVCFCCGFQILYSITFLLDQVEITYILYPLVLQIFNNVINDLVKQVLLATPTITEGKQLRYFLALKMNQQLDSGSYKLIIMNAILLSKHKVKCSDPECNCMKEDSSEEVTNVKFLSDYQIQKFYNQKIRHWNKRLKKDDDINLIHYISVLNYFGYVTQAYQECKRILSQNQLIKSKQGFLTHSESSRFSDGNSSQSEQIRQSVKKTQKIIKLKLVHTKVSTLSEQKLKILMQQIKTNLQHCFQRSQNKQQEDLSLAIELFLISEDQNEEVKQEVMQALRMKLQFFQLITQNQSISTRMLFDRSKKLSMFFEKIELQLLQQYEQFPSYRIQSINCFIQAELMNNYLKSFKIQNLSTISDEKLLNMRKALRVNLFGKNIVYLMLQINENFNSMQIVKASNNANQFFSYPQAEFAKQQSIDFLLPDAIQEIHSSLVQSFLLTGKGKYFRNVDLSFLQHPKGLLKTFNFFFDLNLGKSEDLQFTAFFEDYTSTSGYILVDLSYVVGGVTQQFFEKAGWKQSEIKENSERLSYSFKVPISSVIPNFQLLYAENKDQQKLYNVAVTMPLKKLQEDKSQSTQRDSLWRNHSEQYSATIIIRSRDVYGYKYFVIEFEEIRAVVLEQKTIDQTIFAEEFSEIISEGSNKEAEVNQPQEFNYILPKQNFLDESTPVIEAKQYDQSFNMNNQYLDQTLKRQIDSSKSYQQQKFFDIKDFDLNESSYKTEKVLSQNQRLNQLYQIDLEQIDQEMKQNIKLQLQLDKQLNEEKDVQNDDRASQVSSLIGVRKSTFYKKYDIITKSIQKDRKPASLLLCNSILTLFFLVSVTYFSLVIASTQKEFSQFLQEIDMLLFHSSFFAPLEMFLSIRLQILFYGTQRNLRIISEQEYWTYYAWLFGKVDFCYQAMQQNFISQLANPYLQDFFVDEYVDVRLMYRVASETYTTRVTLRQSLFILLEAHYQFKRVYELNQTLANRPFQTYFYANYFPMDEKFRTTTNKILDYSLVRTDLVNKLWIQTWIPFLVVSGLLILFSYWYYKKYLQFYEYHLELYKFIDRSAIERDVERYKLLTTILSTDTDLLFKYQFDLEQKEKFMIAEKLKMEQTPKKYQNDHQQRKLLSRQSQQLPKLPSMVGFSIFLSFFFVTSFIIYSQTKLYLDKYQYTAEFYKNTGDLQYVVPSAYGQRQFSGFIAAFAYLNETDREKLRQRIRTGVVQMNNYSAALQFFDEENLLTNQELISIIQFLKSNSVCDVFTKDEVQDFIFYCDKALEGSLLKGLLTSLNFIANYIQTEFSINNFTRAVSYNQFEVEGTFILYQVISKIIEFLKNGLISATNSHIDSVVGLSVFYIVSCLLMMAAQYLIVWQFYDHEYNIVKRFVLLLPVNTLLLDDNFERRVRMFYANK